MARSAEGVGVPSKLDPLVPSLWHDRDRAADRRRRRAGGHRGRDTRPRKKRRLDESRLLAVVIGLSAVAVALTLVLPA
jgi:hypothetical protein